MLEPNLVKYYGKKSFKISFCHFEKHCRIRAQMSNKIKITMAISWIHPRLLTLFTSHICGYLNLQNSLGTTGKNLVNVFYNVIDT